MGRIARNAWARDPSGRLEVARLLRHDVHPEGLDVERIRMLEASTLPLSSVGGQIISVIRGQVRLELLGERLVLEAQTHLFLPSGLDVELEAQSGTELMRASAPDARQACGTRPILRDETFIAASAVDAQALRWILTPQYLSRRIFLHHDTTLLSRSGQAISWFRTTMFDVVGLPSNEDGEPVFKMAYGSRTEWNGVYEVEGHARARFARHPYADLGQAWEPWALLDGECVYHLDELGTEDPAIVDPYTGRARLQRNKHEVFIERGGFVSLFCLFDPAPTGVERHRPGEYSDYEPLADVLVTEAYELSRREIARFDEMIDRLSWAKATGGLELAKARAEWELYRQGLARALEIEAALERSLIGEGRGRDQVLSRWMLGRRAEIP